MAARPGLKRQKTVYVTGNGPTEDINKTYNLGAQIGTPGNFGRAVRATKTDTKEICCCKIVNKARFHHVGRLHRIWEDMRQEISILRELNHENVVQFKDVFETRNELQIVTELCDGGELFERISRKGSYSEKEAAAIFAQLLQGIAYMHEKEIIHCDLKPDNFLFKDKTETSTIKIIDFGMSKRLPRHKEKLNALCGTPYYTAPEILAKKYSHAADLWSLGVVLFVMLFGYPPFYVDPALYGRKENDMIYKKIRRGFDPKVRKGYGSHFPQAIPVSDEARDIISHLLVSEPKERLTALEALDHPWVRNRANNNNKLPATVTRGIQSFHKRCNFKNIVCHTFRDKLTLHQVDNVNDALREMDKNKDGKISQGEFVAAMKKIASEETQASLEELFRLIDTDNSQFIEYEELKTAAYAEHVQAQDERLYEQFTAFDLNHDGFISKDELQKVLDSQIEHIKKSGSKAHFSVEEAIQAMTEIDTNEDGRIDYNEFLAALYPDLNEKFELPEEANEKLSAAPPRLLKGHTDDMED